MLSPLKILIATIIVVFACPAASAQEEGHKATAQSSRYSERMVASEMSRTPHPYLLDFSSRAKWSYAIGIEMEAMLDTYLRYGDERIISYLQEYTDTMIDERGFIRSYKLEDYNLDQVRTGRFLTRMYELLPEAKNLHAIHTLMQQLDKQPRTDSDSIYWHKAIYAGQVWLDGIFMGLPFRVLSAKAFSDDDASREIYEDAVGQVVATYRRTYDSLTGLNRHAWDETGEMFWSDKVNGQSLHCWGRAQGWFTMALTEILDVIPEDTKGRDMLVEILRQVLDSVLRWQDKESGLWYQVMDCPGREGNYLESTCSCMFAYSLMKAGQKGWVDSSYEEEGRKAYRNILRRFIQEENDDSISLTDCCAVAGLGPGLSEKVVAAAPGVKENRRRDGSYSYYLSEPIRKNDPKGIGPFIWSSLCYEKNCDN